MHVIYITGLGDSRPVWQFRVVMKTWQLYGVKPYFFKVDWANGTLIEKLERLDRLITDLSSKDHRKVGLIGISAGASLALHTFVSHPDNVTGIVTICGKILRPESIHEMVKSQNPAFAESMAFMPDTLQKLTPELKSRLLCVYPLIDMVVATQDQHVPGARKRRVFSFGHGFSIALQLTFGARKNIRLLKQHI